MFLREIVATVLVGLALPIGIGGRASRQITDCSQYNYSTSPTVHPTEGYQGHTTGGHYMNGGYSLSCSYSNRSPGTPCYSTCSANASVNALENGTLTSSLIEHGVAGNKAGSSNLANGAAISCTAAAAYFVRQCLVDTSCLLTASVSLGELIGRQRKYKRHR